MPALRMRALAIGLTLAALLIALTTARADDHDGDDGDGDNCDAAAGAVAQSAWRSPDLTVAEHRLIEQATDRRQRVRAAAIDALRALPADRRAVVIEAGLEHPDVRVQRLAVDLLGGLPREHAAALETCVRKLVNLLAEDYPASASPLYATARQSLLRLGATAVEAVAQCLDERDLDDDPTLLELPDLLDRQRVLDLLDELPVMPEGAYRPSPRAFELFAESLAKRPGGIESAIACIEPLVHTPARFNDLLMRRADLRDYRTLALLLLGDLGRLAPTATAVALQRRLLDLRAEDTGDVVRTTLPAWRFADTRDPAIALECALHRLGDGAILTAAREAVRRRANENEDASPSLVFVARANCAWVRAWRGECEQAAVEYADALRLVDDDAVRTTIAHHDLAMVWAEFARAMARLPEDVALPVERFPRAPAGPGALAAAAPSTCREATTTALQAAVALGYRDVEWLAGCRDFDRYAGDPDIAPLLEAKPKTADDERQPWGEE